LAKLIVGLGNIGHEYEKTRHNVGFFIVDRLAEELGIAFQRTKFHGQFGELLAPSGEKIILLKPQTMMNLSGKSVAPWMDFLKLAGEDTLVIHDELDLPLGRMKGQWAGSSGGHNGIASILENLGHSDFCRLRVGVGRPAAKHQVIRFVLSPFGSEELPLVKETVEKGLEAAQVFLKMGLDPMMQMVNRKAPSQKPPS